MNYKQVDAMGVSEGDLFYIEGKRYRLTKKTSTAMAVERWYWFDVLAEWITRKLGGA